MLYKLLNELKPEQKYFISRNFLFQQPVQNYLVDYFKGALSNNISQSNQVGYAIFDLFILELLDNKNIYEEIQLNQKIYQKLSESFINENELPNLIWLLFKSELNRYNTPEKFAEKLFKVTIADSFITSVVSILIFVFLNRKENRYTNRKSRKYGTDINEATGEAKLRIEGIARKYKVKIATTHWIKVNNKFISNIFGEFDKTTEKIIEKGSFQKEIEAVFKELQKEFNEIENSFVMSNFSTNELKSIIDSLKVGVTFTGGLSFLTVTIVQTTVIPATFLGSTGLASILGMSGTTVTTLQSVAMFSVIDLTGIFATVVGGFLVFFMWKNRDELRGKLLKSVDRSLIEVLDNLEKMRKEEQKRFKEIETDVQNYKNGVVSI